MIAAARGPQDCWNKPEEETRLDASSEMPEDVRPAQTGRADEKKADEEAKPEGMVAISRRRRDEFKQMSCNDIQATSREVSVRTHTRGGC